MGTKMQVDKPILNRRGSRRAPSVFKVLINGESRAEYSGNISREGLFIVTRSPRALGEIIGFQLSFPGLLDPIDLRGEVRWVSEGDDNGPPGMGLQLLLDVPQAARFAAIADAAEQAAGPAGLYSDVRTDVRPDIDKAHSYRMLVCEDNPHAREMFVYGLRKLATAPGPDNVLIDIVEANDGQDAWAHIEHDGNFHLIVVDMYMPVLNGGDLIVRLKQKESLENIPIIAVSSSLESRSVALASGADIFLPKPVRLNDILITVRALLCLP